MKRILINATHNEEIRVALCKGNHMYDFDLENRTREQKKSNIYKAHITRVEPSLEAVFVEYGAERQGFLPIREIAKEYLSGNPRNENIRNLIKEGDTLIVQVEKEERGNKGAALSTYISLAGRYLVLMPNNPRGGGISRQISGKNREEMKRIVSNLQMPKGMSVIIRTAGTGKSQEDMQHDLNHLLNIWKAIGEQDKEHKSPRLVHQEAGVVTRALRDYMRDDISEIWIDSANAYDEAVYFIKSVMPKQLGKVRKYTDLEPMLTRFDIEKQIETTYQREVRLPAGGSIVIDQTEAMVAIDINSAKSTKGSDVAATAYHTNLEAAEEIARQLRLRDMGGLVVIDFIDMYDNAHQKEVTKRLIDSTKFDRARVQFGEISKFGLMEMSRQRLRPSLEESTAYQCPRCHGTGMIRDIRSLSLAIVRQVEQLALTHRQGEIQAEVPTDIAAFILNEKRDTLVYLEQDSGARITILPHAHLESPKYNIHYKPDGFAPSSYERISNSEDKHTNDRGYEVNWQMADNDRPDHQPTRQPKKGSNSKEQTDNIIKPNIKTINENLSTQHTRTQQTARQQNNQPTNQQANQQQVKPQTDQPKAVAWLSNLFAPTPQAQTVEAISSQEAAQAIESIVNNGGQSLGSFGQVDMNALAQPQSQSPSQSTNQVTTDNQNTASNNSGGNSGGNSESHQNKRRTPRNEKGRDKSDRRNNNRNAKKYNKYNKTDSNDKSENNERDERNNRTQKPDFKNDNKSEQKSDKSKRDPNSRRDSRGEFPRGETLQLSEQKPSAEQVQINEKEQPQENQGQQRSARNDKRQNRQDRNEKRHNKSRNERSQKPQGKVQKKTNPNEVNLQVSRNEKDARKSKQPETVHLSLDNSKPVVQSIVQPPAKTAVKIDNQKPQVSQEQSNISDISQPQVLTKEVLQPKTEKVVEQPVEAKLQVSEASHAIETAVKAVQIKAETQPEANEATQVETQVAVNRTVRADGRANNDPRVVLEELATKLAEQLAKDKPTLSEATDGKNKPVLNQKPMSIFGSVGEFLRATLDKAEERIKTEGVIACFIAAMEKVKQSQITPDSVIENTVTEANKIESIVSKADIEAELNKFDFSNYGYQSLSAEFMSEFHLLTTSSGQFDTVQGKTETAPTPIGKRASNDPRGQYSEFLEVIEVVDTAITATPVTEQSNVDSVADTVVEITKLDPSEAELSQQHVEKPSEIQSIEQSKTSLEAHKTARQSKVTTNTDDKSTDDFADAFGRMLETTDNTANLAEQNTDPEATLDIDSSSQSDEDVQPTDAGTNHVEADDGKERSKTSFDKYKSMLASVSNQLSVGQTGTNLFLNTPVVPKSRSRKKEDE